MIARLTVVLAMPYVPLLLVLLALHSGCATLTPQARVRTQAAWRLRQCRGPRPTPDEQMTCAVQVRDWCRAQGLETYCGENDL